MKSMFTKLHIGQPLLAILYREYAPFSHLQVSNTVGKHEFMSRAYARADAGCGVSLMEFGVRMIQR